MEDEPKPESGLFLVEQTKPQSASFLTADENQDDFDELESRLLLQFQPVGETETVIVKDMAQFHWLKERAIRYESKLSKDAISRDSLANYRLTNERAFTNALRVLLGLQKQRKTAEAQRPRLADD